MWTVVYLPAAEEELGKLPSTERAAVSNAVKKLENIGPALPFPHSGDARKADGMRELRPRRGSSPWRPIYCRRGDTFVIAAIAPDGQSDSRGFNQACARAVERIAELEEE